MTNFLFNLVKLSDYPFVYSIAGLFISINNRNIFEYVDPVLIVSLVTFVGIFATTLAITDPFGHLIKYRLKIKFRFARDAIDLEIQRQIDLMNKILQRNIVTDLVVLHSQTKHGKSFRAKVVDSLIGREHVDTYSQLLKMKSIRTNWITYEIDKIVSTIYFLIILIGLAIVLSIQPSSIQILDLFTIQDTPLVNNQTIAINTNLTSVENQEMKGGINSIEILTMILTTCAIGLVFIIYRSYLRLTVYVNAIITYFYVNELLIPRAKEIMDLSSNSPPGHQFLKDQMKINIESIISKLQEIVNTMNSKDWGLTDVFTNSLLTSTKELLDYSSILKINRIKLS